MSDRATLAKATITLLKSMDTRLGKIESQLQTLLEASGVKQPVTADEKLREAVMRGQTVDAVQEADGTVYQRIAVDDGWIALKLMQMTDDGEHKEYVFIEGFHETIRGERRALNLDERGELVYVS